MPVSPARATAFDILLRAEQEDAYASELLHSARRGKLSVADRGLATEIVMGVLRWRSRLDEDIGGASFKPLDKLDQEVVIALRMAVYQIRCLTRVPVRAAINESVELVKRAKKRSAASFVNALLRKVAAMLTNKQFEQDAGGDLVPQEMARVFAHPLWLVERWITQFGLVRVRAICVADQLARATALRLDSPQVAKELEDQCIVLGPGSLLTGARIVKAGDVTQTAAFREGRVFIQDQGSQLVAALVGTADRILDCCAAPGGKTAAIAVRNPTARIVAAELHLHRAGILRKRVRAANVQVINADASRLPLTGGFDRVLADVPCSGTGTLAGNPEIKWRLKPQDLGDLHNKQVAILRAALQQLAPGGRAVYSTCSLEREENEDVMEDVLLDATRFRLLDCRVELERLRNGGELAWPDLDSLLSGPFLRTIPGVHPCEGFFAGVIERSA